MRMRTLPGAVAGLGLMAMIVAVSPSLGRAESGSGSAATVGAALEGGKGSVDLRYRLEFVDEDGIDEQSWASTLRTAIRYQSMQYRQFDLFLEATNVANIGHDAYNSGSNGQSGYPTVADPTLSRMNQAYVRWSPAQATGTLGRQELVFDNARFIGNVGWRQTHQTFDALRLDFAATEWLDARYTFVDRVHRINGSRNDLLGHFANVDVDAGPFGHLAGYAYLLDFDDDALFTSSTNTFGASWTGTHDFPDQGWNARWRAEYALQRDGGDNPDRVRADYVHLNAAAGHPVLTGQLGWERLSGDADDGRFTTTFATLHAFNGWADKFLSTPASGLEDLYVTATGTWNRFGYQATWHDFGAASGGATYGSEIDAMLSYKTTWNQTFALKAAFYSADEHSTDTTKAWAFTTYAF